VDDYFKKGNPGTMATSSFADISNWLPTEAYESVQSMIQNEVSQGLWDNQTHIDGWCMIAVSPTQGLNNSWVTYTYQLISDNTQTTTVIWPSGWPAPAENINGELPGHFFSGGTTGGSTETSDSVGVGVEAVLYETYAAPANPPTYKTAGDCV
jgi:hypothetical protein